MTYQDKLILFIKLKDKFIYAQVKKRYINKKDVENVKTWDEKVCKRIYNILKENILEKDADWLQIDTCIWCILNLTPKDTYTKLGCNNCFYGKNHGTCDAAIDMDEYTHYEKLCRSGILDKLTNEFYVELIKQIEEKKK